MLTSLFSDLTPEKLANLKGLNYFCNMQLRYGKEEKRHKDRKAPKEKEEAYLRSRGIHPYYTRRKTKRDAVRNEQTES